MKTRQITFAAVIAALYVALCFLTQPISYGIVQLRVAEMLAIAPLLFGWSGVIGLSVGCAIANTMSAYGVLDIVLGTSITLISAILTMLLSKHKFVALLPPVVLNALFLPIIWMWLGEELVYHMVMLSLLVSQALAIYVLGLPVYYGLKKAGIDRMIKTYNTKDEKTRLEE